MIESQQDFFEKIYTYYFDLCGCKVEPKYIEIVSKKLSDSFFDQYATFRKSYPKSYKRYSSFDLKDLDNPLTHDLIVKILKEMRLDDYQKIGACFLNKSLDEFSSYEANRKRFKNMF